MVSNAEGATSAANTRHTTEAKPRQYSGQGDTVQNLILFVGGMATILISFLLFASYPDSPWLFFVGILVYGLALLVPVAILPSRTAKHAAGGKDIAMHLPSGAHEMPAGRRSIEH